MEVKFKLDTEKALKAAVTIAAAYGLCCVSKGTEFHQLAAANAFVLVLSSQSSMALAWFPKNPPKQE
jgi:hypothetical protein